MNSTNQNFRQRKESFKKVSLRRFLPKDRFDQLSRNISSLQDAQNYQSYRDEQEKSFVMKTFRMIQKINTDSQVEIHLELQKLLFHAIRNNNNPQLPLNSHLSFFKTFNLILVKRDTVLPEDIDSIGFEIKIKTFIKQFIKKQDFKNWCLKYRNITENTLFDLDDIQVQQTTNQIEPQAQQIDPSSVDGHVQNTFGFKMNEVIQQRETKKLQQRIKQFNNAFPSCLNAVVFILISMHELLSQPSKFKMLHQIEKKLKEIGSFTVHVKLYFQRISNGHRFRLQSYKGYIVLYEILKILMPIDCFQLLQRCKQSQFKASIDNAIFTIGNTGSGKTTSILSLLGYPLNKIRTNLGQQLQVQGEIKQQHTNLKTSDHSESVTTHLSCYRLNEKISIVDTPGFEDTNGALVDIVNQVSLQNAYLKCKNVCYLLLCDSNSLNGSKGQNIKKLARNISNRFEYGTFEQLQSFLLIVFNDKYSLVNEDNLQMIKENICELLEDQQMRHNNEKYKIALKLILSCLDNEHNHYNPRDPSSIQQIKKSIFNLQYNECRKLKCEFEDRTLQDIEKCCKYLASSIRDYERKNDITNVRFYYSMINQFYEVIPKFIKKTKDQVDVVLQRNSLNIYNTIVSQLNQIISLNFEHDQNWFDELTKLVKQLVALNALAKDNQNIKSEKELMEFIHDYQSKLKEILSKNVDPSKIKNYCVFYRKFNEVFSPYLNNFFQSIQQNLYKSLKENRQKLQSNFSNLQMRQFDKNIEKYEILTQFYSLFSNQTKVFSRTQDIPPKKKLLQKYQSQIQALAKQIQTFITLITSYLRNSSQEASINLQQYQKLLQKYQKYTQSSSLGIKEEYLTFYQHIYSSISEEYQKITKEYQQFFQEKYKNEQQRLKMTTRILKVKQVIQKTSNKDFKQRIKKLLDEIIVISSNVQYMTLETIKKLSFCLNNQTVEKIINYQGLKQKVKSIYEFKQALRVEFNDEISKEYKKFVDQMNKIESVLETKLANHGQGINFSDILNLFKIYKNVAGGNEQFRQLLEKIQSKLCQSVTKQCNSVTETFKKLKIDNYQGLHRNLSRNIVKILLNYIINIHIPFANQPSLFLNDNLKNTFQYVYESISQFFTQIQTMINKERQVKFPSQLREKLISEQKDHQELLKKLNQYVDSVSYIHMFMRKNIEENEKVKNYLEKKISANEMNQENKITIGEINQQIKAFFERRLRHINQCLNKVQLSKYNIQMFNCLRKEVQALISLENELTENDQLEATHKMVEINQKIYVKITAIEGKLADQIQILFSQNNPHTLLVDRIVALYVDLKRNARNLISQQSASNLEKMQSQLSNYLRLKKAQIDNFQNNLDQSRNINESFPSLIRQLIDISYEFNSKLGQQKETFEIQFLNNIEQQKLFLIEKFKQEFECLRIQVESDQNAGDYINAEKKIRKLQKINHIFQKASTIPNQDIQQVESMDRGYSKVIQQLKTYSKVIQQLKTRLFEKKSYLCSIFQKDELLIEDIDQLQSIFKNTSQQQKHSLIKKVRDFINKQVRNCREGNINQRKQKYDAFQEASLRIPNEIKERLSLGSFMSNLQADIERQQAQFVKDLKNMSLKTSQEKQRILNGFNLLQNSSDKRIILEKIRTYLNQVMKVMADQSEVMKKIKLYQAQVLPLYSYLNESHVEIRKIIIENQENYLKMIKSFFELECRNFINLLQSKGKKVEQSQIDLKLEKLFQVIFYFRTKENVFYYQKYINQTKNLFTDFKDQISNFEKYCPIRQYNIEKNQLIKITILKKVLERSNVYKIIIHIFSKYQRNTVNNSDSMMVQNTMDIQQEIVQNVFGQIANKITKFETEFKTQLQTTLTQIKSFSFERITSQDDNLEAQIQQRITRLAQQLKYIKNMSNHFRDYPQLGEISQEEVIKIYRNLDRSLIRSVQNKLEDLQRYIICENQQQKPKDIGYIKKVLNCLTQNQVRFLDKQEAQKRNSAEKIMQQRIKNIKEELFSQLLVINLEMNDFYKETAPQKQQQIQKIKRQKNVYIKDMNQGIMRRLKEIQDQNLNQDPQVIESIKRQEESILDISINKRKEQFQEQIKQIIDEIQSHSQSLLTKYCMQLIKLMKLNQSLDYFTYQQKEIKQQIVVSLFNIESLNLLRQVSKKFSEFKDFDIIIYSIKGLTKMFQFQNQQTFNQKVRAQDIDYTLRGLQTNEQIFSYEDQMLDENDMINKEELKKKYLHTIGIFNDHKSSSKTAKDIIESMSTSDHLQQIASILAVYSLSKTVKGKNNEILSQFIPHPVQIVTLILLITRNSTNEIQSQLAQVKTGEGKSIILATLAIYYARMKLKVQVACYSKYLSKRDHLQFENLFRQFNVSDKIFYGTFNQICQLYLKSNKGNLRDIAKQYLTQKPEQQSFFEKVGLSGKKIGGVICNIGNKLSSFFKKIKQQRSILLIDQVDVLFEAEYLGEIFTPAVKLDTPEFKEFIKYAYQMAKNNKYLQPEQLINSKPFKVCVQKYPKLTKIMQMQVYGVIQGLYNKSPETYEINNNQIKYKDKDSLSTNLHYGYQTIFANCRQYEAGKISQTNFQKNMFIPIKIGELSYLELPRNTIIQGLSGTVSSLSASKYKILRNKYNILQKHIYILPSIFGQKDVRKTEFYLTNNQTFYNKIISCLTSYVQNDRPVVICFQNYKQLKNFQRSTQFSALNIKCNYLHQLQNSQMRDKAVKGAGNKRTVTLMTSQFSRGTDFSVVDRRVKNAGGLGLIMAYIPKSQSEYEQFKGRTGRQGAEGSIDIFLNTDYFSEILNSNKFSDDVQIFSQPKNILISLEMYWKALDNKQQIEKEKQLKESTQKHNRFINIIQNITNAEKEKEFIQYINQLNKFQKLQLYSILFGIDGTCSMRIIFQKLIQTLNNILNNVEKIKKKLNVRAQFELKIAVYRNYSSGENILETTGSQTSPQHLIEFLTNIKVQGGQGNQAIEVLYRYINTSEKPFNMLILIGDAPPNKNQEIQNKRKQVKNKPNQWWERYQKSQKYNRQFFDIVSAQEQMKKFNRQSFVIHGLAIKTAQTNSDTSRNANFQRYITNITRQFNGQSKNLDFEKQNTDSELDQFITTKIACLINGSQDLDKIQKIYRENCKKTYT